MHHEKHDSSSSSAELLWKHFGKTFGTRWFEQFGPKPSDDWEKALGGLRPDQVRGGLSKLRAAPVPYAGWLPSLPEFLSFARNVQASPAPRIEPYYPKWLALVNQLFFIWLQREISAKRRK